MEINGNKNKGSSHSNSGKILIPRITPNLDIRNRMVELKKPIRRVVLFHNITGTLLLRDTAFAFFFIHKSSVHVLLLEVDVPCLFTSNIT